MTPFSLLCLSILNYCLVRLIHQPKGKYWHPLFFSESSALLAKPNISAFGISPVFQNCLKLRPFFAFQEIKYFVRSICTDPLSQVLNQLFEFGCPALQLSIFLGCQTFVLLQICIKCELISQLTAAWLAVCPDFSALLSPESVTVLLYFRLQY